MLALSPYTLIPITVLIHDWNQPGPSSLIRNHMGIQKIKRPTVFHVNGRYTLDGLRKERPKCSSSAPSHLPVPPQMKGGRAQAGCEEETGKFRSLAVHFWRGSRHPSDSGRGLFTDPLTCLNSSGNKKLLQTVAAIIRVSLQADPPFVSSMKIYIYLTLVWLLINLCASSFARFANAVITFTPKVLWGLLLYVNDESMEFNKNQENYMTNVSLLARERGRYIP